MVCIFAHFLREGGGVRPTENQFSPKAFFNFFTKKAVCLDGACGAVHDQIVRAKFRDFFHKHVVIPFFQTSIKEFNFVVGVSLQNGGTIGQLPRVISENVVVFGAIGPTTGRMDHCITVGIDSNGVTNSYFHRFPLLGMRYFDYRPKGFDGLLPPLFPESKKGSHVA